MNDKHTLDPDDPEGARDVQEKILESLTPLPLPPGQASAIKLRLFERIRASRDAGKDFINVRIEDGEWESLVPGVRVKRLCQRQRAVLLDLQPGAIIPFHRHHEDEECVVLRGEAELGGITVREGDYHLASAGSRHGAVRSPSGALLYLRGTSIGHGLEVARDVLTALLPGLGQVPCTIPSNGGEWADYAPGVRVKILRDDGHSRSMLLRLEPGAAAERHHHPLDEECLVMEGEVFIGDQLMRPGDYQLAPQGTDHPLVSSDIGSLLFVRGASAG
ncbi:MAG TPA: cupin domain-containing protein [Rhodocyclaceae bacterium]|uniref:cupin domain-containing protein n=1 Tax=Zoogloea sp. TaxID=49181 RepID=UPI002C871AB1|nr:cupin domain-containing protein [Zoogloea sp.]HMV63509.1 cupin domain-containing protein [Rhodocyclaceae bacterium]HMW52120.1 cupin domain-containing protein [Rhodocyclaceae bacterium]HMY48434.1 cupin domain-containing protein [Rhodocyclaceae bacterium]HMZ75924.1 cupin domain-containing protein [Rhodocyclaceae bacterium]HNA67972.1 cupin domain-containing protein [Rhodocyclaceae bacterium]